MSSATVAAAPALGRSSLRSAAVRQTLTERRPTWPLTAMFAGYPLWWLLGFGEAACLLLTVPMARYLWRHRDIPTPRGFGMWLLYLVWVLGGLAVLQVHAPGGETGASAGRYLTFTYRFLWYVAATVVALYIAERRRDLSVAAVCRALANMFVVVTAGGLLGIVAPRLQFRSAIEYVLPGPIRTTGFVQAIVHPVTAQVQDFLGYEQPRPSAPFPFTNEWGLVLACFLPFFVAAWCRPDAGWRRYAAPVVLTAAAIAVVYSLNRALWLGILVAGAFAVFRTATTRQLKIAGLVAGAAALTGVVVALTPLGALIADRIAHPNSNTGRANLGALTIRSVLDGSPVVGFGTPRNVQGNFSSIATAASSLCPGCSPAPLGTQGQLWLVLFCSGVVGLVLYLGFVLGQVLRHVRLTSPYAIAALCVLIAHVVTMPFYDSIGPGQIAILAAIALLWRTAPEAGRPLGSKSLTDRLRAGRRALPVAVALAVAGGALGGLVTYVRGVPSVAQESLYLPLPISSQPSRAPSLDTLAQLVTADEVLAAISKDAPGSPGRMTLAEQVTVTAAPNTRILQVQYQASTAAAALHGVQTLTEAYRLVVRRSDSIMHRPPFSQVVSPPRLLSTNDPWVIAITTGIAVGGAGGLCVGSLRRRNAPHVVRAGS